MLKKLKDKENHLQPPFINILKHPIKSLIFTVLVTVAESMVTLIENLLGITDTHSVYDDVPILVVRISIEITLPLLNL